MDQIINGLHLDQIIAKVSEQIGVAIDQLCTILMNQARVQLIYDIVYCVVFLIISATLIHYFKKYCKKYNESTDYCESDHYATIATIFAIIGVLFIIFGGIAFVADLKEIIQILVNPQIWIFDFIMNYAK